jgi:cytochrome c553
LHGRTRLLPYHCNHEKNLRTSRARRHFQCRRSSGNPKAAKVEACIGCHGIAEYKASFPEVYRVPKIGGQSAKYIESALNAYKKGDRKHPSMHGIAASLSDQDIADVAAYYAQMPTATAQK